MRYILEFGAGARLRISRAMSSLAILEFGAGARLRISRATSSLFFRFFYIRLIIIIIIIIIQQRVPTLGYRNCATEISLLEVAFDC